MTKPIDWTNVEETAKVLAGNWKDVRQLRLVAKRRGTGPRELVHLLHQQRPVGHPGKE